MLCQGNQFLVLFGILQHVGWVERPVRRLVRRSPKGKGGSETHHNVWRSCYLMGFALLNPSYVLRASAGATLPLQGRVNGAPSGARKGVLDSVTLLG